ncbi:MAG: metalloregulator ArsR/SmtB family transcription factor [Oscillospiraceae bacterium]|nr:metalloregulator ArsR/SmtB family transcription factor [Oscillospiraceae bacterium]
MRIYFDNPLATRENPVCAYESTRVFSAFCDETRLKVLELLRGGEKCANVLLEQVSIRQSTLSHHMKILVESGVVRARRAGKRTYYAISESGAEYAEYLLKKLTNTINTQPFQTSLVTQNISINQNYTIKDGVKMNPINTNNESFAIMADTSCDLPAEILAEYGIERVPITYELDGAPHNGGYWQEISGKDFYDTLRQGGVAKTAQINPEVFVEVFTNHAKQGKGLIFIILSSGLSGTYQSAQIALTQVRETYPDCRIFPIDSISASIGLGLLAILAGKKRAAGVSVEETAAFLEEKKHSCFGLFTVDDLMYLHRGGRLSKLSAVAGSVLKVKPILNLAPDGTLAVKDKARGRKASMETLAAQFKRSIKPGAVLDTVLVTHTDCESEAAALAEMLKANADIKQVELMLMGPIIGAHLGPGALIILFEAGMSRGEYEGRFY